MTPTTTTSPSTLAADVLALHGRLHSLFSWAKTIDVSFGITYIEITVFWRVDTAHSSHQRIPYSDFATTFDYRCNLLRQAYQQTL